MNTLPEAADSRHEYRWSPHGIEVTARNGDWRGYYSLRHCRSAGDQPTRLVLIGFAYGESPAEIAVPFVTLCDICRWITDAHAGDPRYNHN